MDKELICKEYEMLHGEIEKKIELQNNLLIFMVTATATIITIAAQSKNLLLYLFPFFIIIPTMNRITYYRKAIARISAYMIVFLEPKLNGISWETRNLQLNRRNDEEKKDKRKIKLDYYECPLLSVICYFLYLYECKAYQLRNFGDLVKMAGPVFLIAIVIYLTYRINEFSKDREAMMNSWKNIEAIEKRVKK